MTEQVEIYVNNVVAATDKAALCQIDEEEVWIPWSCIDEGSEIQKKGDKGLMWIPGWLAQEKGLD